MANLGRRFDSVAPGEPLSPHGRLQAETLADWFLERAIRPDLILTSPLRRARETAAPLQRRSGRPLLVADLLREMASGEWDRRSSLDLADDPAFLAWREDPEVAPPGGGERLSDVAGRVLRLLDLLRRLAPHSSGALFTHAHGLHAGLSIAGRLRGEDGRVERVPNCAIVHLRHAGGAWRLIELDRSVRDLARTRSEAAR